MRVLICGAGIAGPTLAWFLSKTGAHIDIIEKSQCLRTQGQSIDFKGSAVSIIKKMGLMDQIKRLNTMEKGTQFINPKGRPFATFPIDEGQSASLSSEFEILRGDFASLLYDATKDHPNITYHFNTTIASVLSNTPTSVTVSLSNGSTSSFDLLVLANGQNSTIRQSLFPPSTTKILSLNMYTAYWTIPRLAHDNDLWQIYISLNSRLLSLRPDPHGTIRATVTIMPRTPTQHAAWQAAAAATSNPSHGARPTQIALLKSEFANAGWQAPRLLAALDHSELNDFYFHAMQQVKMSRWSTSTGRVVCLGDTAHAPSPVAGGGTSLAILGAYVLAGELSKVGEGEVGVGGALEEYERVLKPYVEDAQRVPWGMPGLAHPVTGWGRWMLQGVIWVIAKVVAVPWVKERLGGGHEDDFELPSYPGIDDKEEEGGGR